MLTKIFTHHQVMAAFVEFISVFVFQGSPRGQRFSGFKSRTQLSHPDATSSSGLGRSGLYYHMCYNFRSASASMNNIWTIRQTVFYHQFDIKEGTALWISAKGNLDMKTMIGEAVKRMDRNDFQDVGSCFASTLRIHTLHSQLCTKGWLEYVEYLEDELDVR
jgi:hypothetical protein